MATHYKGQRISELLADIEHIKRTIDDNAQTDNPKEQSIIAEGYAKLALMKAKLTSLQGDSHVKKGKKPR
jgi:hypothetical protein